mmetsp:Transcript_8843/g.14995  ORF Transcript_8843/g.14995 Transcript_8843/m.14995 type:complete len:103 (-) Transcript_8843:3-311(-)
MYLKFVWGRLKIPADCSDLAYKHQISTSCQDENALPESHTCFFTIDFPKYSSYEIMKDRLTKAIEMCGEIDADYDPDDIANEDDDRENGYGGYGGYGSEEEE